MSLIDWCQWLQQTPFAVAITESSWLFPVIEGSHILALSLSVGMIVLFDLRLLGVAFRGEAVSRMMKQVMPWSLTGFGVMFITGILLFITQAGKAYGNVFFRTKLVFLVLLGINAAFYQKKFYPKMADWDMAGIAPFGVRLCAGLSLAAWMVVIVCGRTMAYEF